MKFLLIFFLLSPLPFEYSFAKKNKEIIKKSRKQKVAKKKRKRKRRRKKKSKVTLGKALKYIDKTQSFISSSWLGVNYGMDSYFSDQSYKKSENKSRIMAYYEFYKKEGRPLENNFDIKIKFHLPKLNKKLSVAIQKERDEILESRSNQAIRSEVTKGSEYSASISYQLEQIPYFDTEFKTGLRFLLPLDPYAKLGFHKGINASWMNIHFEQKFIQYKQDEFREYTRLSFSKKINHKFSIAQDNTLSWDDRDDDFVLRDSLGLTQQISSKSSLSYSVGANAALSPTLYYNKYDAAIGLRHLLYKEWLLGYISTGSEFLKSNDWEMDQFAVFRLEVLFQ